MKIGSNLRMYSDKKRKSQEELADLLGVERKTYANWEKDVADVKSSFIPKLAEILEVSIADLFKKQNSETFIDQTNDNNSSNHSIILVLPDKESVHDLINVIKDKVGAKLSKEE